MPAPFRTRRLVEFHDTDMAGIMHFASYFIYMESAEHELLRAAGLSVHGRLAGETVGFPRVSARCDFHAPARCEDELDLEVRVTRLGQKSVTYEIRFLRGEELLAVGLSTCVCCRQRDDGRWESRPLPEEFVERLREHETGENAQ